MANSHLLNFQTLVVLAIISQPSSYALAGSIRLQAYQLHNRLAGVPPNPDTLADMEKKLEAGDYKAAAEVAMANKSFLEVVVRNFAASMTNINQSIKAPFNDMTATIIGAARDNISYASLLWDDVLYVGTGTVVGNPATPDSYSKSSNSHYVSLEKLGDLDQRLVKVSQKAANLSQPAGLFTTRAWGEAFFRDGTNRRAYRFVHVNFFCADLEAHMDNQLPDYRIRQDVSRADTEVFKEKCAGCHTHMDGNAGAFAYYDYDNASGVINTPGVVASKYFREADEYPKGYRTIDDSWINFLPKGINDSFGFKNVDTKKEIHGKGLVEFGKMIGSSDEFARCTVKRVWAAVCLSRPKEGNKAQTANVEALAKDFAADGYNLKSLFANTAQICLQ